MQDYVEDLLRKRADARDGDLRSPRLGSPDLLDCWAVARLERVRWDGTEQCPLAWDRKQSRGSRTQTAAPGMSKVDDFFFTASLLREETLAREPQFDP